LNLGGAWIEDFTLTFKEGRAVNATAKKGEQSLRTMLDTDEGASRLGEVALVPHSSPISMSGLVFCNALLDENAASHLALGQAMRFNMKDGETMSDDEFSSSGANLSGIHVDFMVGSERMDVDGITADGDCEALMRNGEWAFEA
jgi:aminopeptidase